MSDAIVLDVADATPVRLDVGDADPIARQEIAELAERVTTVEGDVTALDSRMDTAEGDISTLGTAVDGIDARVEAIEADGSVTPAKLADTPFPSLLAGAARSLTGNEPTEATFLDRACPGTTGQATVQSVKGNTIVQDGSLLPVRMEGIETVGFNQWDEQWEVGYIDGGTGQPTTEAQSIRSKNFNRCIPNTNYYCSFSGTAGQAFYLYWYDAGQNFIVRAYPSATSPANASYFKIACYHYGTTYHNDICINLSDPARNGTYEPYWSSQRAITASTYFPDGMRSAGTVRDELTETQAITRVGSVDLGTLTWIYNASAGVFYANLVRSARDGNLTCSKYETSDASNVENMADKSVWNKGYAFTATNVIAKDSAYTDAAAFKAAMSGVMLHYALATPTTTPIDPPLNLTYRAEQGGTERITHTEQSAPPALSIAYGHTAEGIVQEAASAIAAQDGPTATANHAVGSYLTMGGTLYRVTTAIATGEAITPGTNVMATTVMAEVLSLIQ
jgi:hypothetical protein